MRRYLIDVGDVSPAMAPEILPATCNLRWDFHEEERMMQYSRDKYFPQLRTKVINPGGTQQLISNTYTQNNKYLHPTQTSGCQSLDG